MMQIEQVSYSAIKQKRGSPHVWIEGVRLTVAGFERNRRYTRVVDEATQTIILTLVEDGEYVVSGRQRNQRDIPILDINLGRGVTAFTEGTRYRAVYMACQIIISIHHEQQAQYRREKRLISNTMTGTIIEASACTGGGISTAAIHQAFQENRLQSKIDWMVDVNLQYLQSAYAHCPAITVNTKCFASQLEELETQLLTEVDVFSFSLPCTGLSVSGKAKHKKTPEQHESGTSIFGIMAIIKAANPSIIMSENVPEAKGSPMYTLITQELIRRGYRIIEAILDSEQTGTFEQRKRYWFIAVSSGLPDKLFNGVFDFQMKRKYNQLNDLLDSNIPEDAWKDHQYLKDKAISDAAAGKGFKRQLLTGTENKIGTVGRHYNKRRSTEPFIVRDDGKERLLTVEEHAKAKSVPASLVANCTATTGHEILGQSIDFRQAFAPMYILLSNMKAWLNIENNQAA